MKKYFIFAASALALASCSSDDYLGNDPGNTQSGNAAILFGSETGKITRAGNKTGSDAATELDNNFVIVGYKNKEGATPSSSLVFDHYNVNYGSGSYNSTLTNTKGWEYVGQDMGVRGNDLNTTTDGKQTFKPLATTAGSQTIKYWDQSCKSYDFVAFSMGKANGTDIATQYAKPSAVDFNTLTTKAYTLTGNLEQLNNCYISNKKTVAKADYNKGEVSMDFRHATSKVRMALYETIPGYVVNNINFYPATGETTTDATLTGTFFKKGTLTVFFPTTNEENTKDYNLAHVTFKADETDGTTNDLTFSTVNYSNETENQINKSENYLGQSKDKASYCGKVTTQDPDQNEKLNYIPVIPTEGKDENQKDISQNLNLKIDYTLTSTDGSNEQIKVTGATATVPAAYTAWKPGYAYTYIFKISPNTNGTTGGTGDPSGLSAIRFDAVVIDDIESGKQETVTAIEDYDITTYGVKDDKVTTGGDEYPAGADIYATVAVPKDNGYDTEAPTALYTVTIDNDNKTQTITESSVANVIAKGTTTEPLGAEGDAWTTKDGIDIYDNHLAVTKVDTKNYKAGSMYIPTQDGQNMYTDAMKWTAGAAGTVYAVEYVNKDKNIKSYKIVRIAK